MKKMVLFLIFTLVFFISCKKEKTSVVDEILDEDIATIDESVDEVSDEFSDPDKFDGESDDIVDIDEDFDNEPDEDVVKLMRLYVKADAAGADNGLSWKDAFTNLQDAIDAAEEGYEIWVAKGTYKPDRVVNSIPPVSEPSEEWYERFFHFALKNKVAVLGGFAGNETEKELRDWVKNETILSGDLDDSGDLSEGDAYNVILNINIYDDSLIDGFVITGGNADYELQPGVDLHPKQGGGMNNRSTANVTIRNCVFKGNYGFIGGGAMANLKSHPQIYDSVFKENSGARGGAIRNVSASPYVQDTVFNNNSAENGYGGAVFNNDKSRGFFVDCTFSDNIAETGGAISNNIDSAITISGSVFSGNTAVNGGAVSNSQSNPLITFSTFENNSATIGGGAIENFSDASPRITNSIFRNNSATGNATGGAILFNTGIPIVISSLFYGNSGYSGGAVSSISSSGFFINNTFYGNQATGSFGYGGGMFNDINSNHQITNCVFYMNSSAHEGNQIYNSSSIPVISHSDIQESFTNDIWDSSLGTDSGGNFSADPVFRDIGNEDFSLKSSSPCIDKGTNEPFEPGGIAVSYQEDILGNPRTSNTAVDIGAYEYQQ